MSDADGKVEVQIEDRLVSLVGPYSVYGRAFVVRNCALPGYVTNRDNRGRF